MLRRAGVALAAAIAVSTVASTASAAGRPAATSKYGGDVKVAIFDTLPGFCFANNPSNSSLMVHRTFYETLFEKTVGGDMVGLLAESATPSSDMKTWTIKLRPGITFHDGTKFDADAVKLNLDYATGQAAVVAAATAAKTKTAIQAMALKIYTGLSSAASLSNPLGGATGLALLAKNGITDTSAAATLDNVGIIAFGVAAGGFADGGALDKALSADKATSGTLKKLGWAMDADEDFVLKSVGIGTSAAFLANIVSTKSDGALTVTLTLNRAQNDVTGMLYASGRTVMRAPSQFTKGKATCATGRPIGTGPFMAPEGYTLVSTDTIKVVKNPNYWRKDAVTGDQLPYLSSITFTNVKEGSQRAAAVRKGTYDAGQFSGAADATFIKDLRNRKSVVTEFKSPVEYYPSLWLNQAKTGSPFTSKNARLAVLSCLDRVNYNKVRNKGEGTIAKSLVGPKSIMYSTSGFQSFSIAASKRYVAAWKAENPATNTELKFSIPADTSAASKGNAQFLIDTWKKCGITVTYNAEEAAQVIAKTFNSGASSAAEQNAYDAINILLFEGTDVSFNLPFVLSNAYASYGTDGKATTSANVAGKLLKGSVGSILNLNKSVDADTDKLLFAGQAAGSKRAAAVQYQSAVARLQSEGVMGSIVHFYYSMFLSKKGGLTNIGKVKIEAGKTQRIVTNWGIDWSGVQKAG